MDMIIRKYKIKDYIEVKKLLQNIFGIEKCKKKSNNIELVCECDKKIVGYLVINKLYDSVCGNSYYYINYVCVKEEYRNMGIGSLLLDEVFKIALKYKVSYIELTSNKKRVEAHELYKNKGFIIRDTCVFRKELV